MIRKGIYEEAEAAKEMTDAKDSKRPVTGVILVARQFLREKRVDVEDCVDARCGCLVARSVCESHISTFPKI